MTPDFVGPFLAAFALFGQLVVGVGIVAIFAAIVIGTWELVRAAGGRR